MSTFTIDPSVPRERYLLDYIYPVNIPEDALRSREDIELFGSSSTGFKKYDSQLQNRMKTSALNIATMSTVVAEGHRLFLVNPEDVVPIWKSIEHYLQGWLAVMDRGLNKAKVPYQFLKELDEFANKVHPGATRLLSTEMRAVSENALFIENMYAEIGLPAVIGSDDAVKPEGESEAQPRQSIQDSLLEHQISWMR